MRYLSDVYDKGSIKQSIKKILNNPKQLSSQYIQQFYPWINFIVSYKADGTRCLLLIFDDYIYVLTES